MAQNTPVYPSLQDFATAAKPKTKPDQSQAIHINLLARVQNLLYRMPLRHFMSLAYLGVVYIADMAYC